MLNNEFPPLGGGTGTVNRELLQQWSQSAELEIDLVTSALGTRAEQEQFAERVRIYKVPVNNRNIHHSSNRELLTFSAGALAASWGLLRQRSYDFCFAWSALPAGAVALVLRRLKQLRYFVRVCGPDIPGFELRYGRLYPVLTPVIRSTWRGAEMVFAKCGREAEMIRAVEPGVNITLVANGVDLSAFQASPRIPEDGPLRLLCVARLIERKGQHHLIQAVKKLVDQDVDVMLELVGTGDAEFANRALVEQLGISERVHFAGYVPREQIAARYAAAHVFVLASYNEGMSVATLEAMAAGLPTVVTRTGGTAELIREGVTGLTFDWADVDALTTHLALLARDRELVRRMGIAARAQALNFSWHTAADTYLGIFERMAQQASALRRAFA